MRQVKIISLLLKNFKGQKSLYIPFEGQVINISGPNGSGKSTIFDAFTWLLFDKDSQDRSAFEIKTLDSNNQAIHGLEHSVEGVLSVDGQRIQLCKIYKEKWTKVRGDVNETLTGHETLYYYNDIPVKKAEYAAVISKIVDENIFKLITNPLYFSINMKWQDRRNILMQIIGNVTTESIINYKPSLRGIEAILGDMDTDSLKKSLQARRKKLNDDLKQIPARIDELSNTIDLSINFDALECKKAVLLPTIRQYEEQLSKASADPFKEEREKLNQLRRKCMDMEYEASSKRDEPLTAMKTDLQQICNEKSWSTQQLNRKEQELRSINIEIVKNNEARKLKRQDWYKVNEEEFAFDPANAVCPTCKRPFSQEEVDAKYDELLENFNQDKAVRLKAIQQVGMELAGKADELEKQAASINEEITTLNVSIKNSQAKAVELQKQIDGFIPVDTLASNADYITAKNEIDKLEMKMSAPVQQGVNLSKKRQLEAEVTEINRQLAKKEYNENAKARIEELKQQEKKVSQQIAELEGQEYKCEEYIKAKVELLEYSINKKFNNVNFKLFAEQVNGGLSECCEALINGVPFSNANRAAQINAGLDIITTLSEYYDVTAPIFIDNREAVNEIIPLQSQVINLRVSQGDKLIVEGEN